MYYVPEKAGRRSTAHCIGKLCCRVPSIGTSRSASQVGVAEKGVQIGAVFELSFWCNWREYSVSAGP